jgi:outer membrane receptor protein involved in Fe transport
MTRWLPLIAVLVPSAVHAQAMGAVAGHVTVDGEPAAGAIVELGSRVEIAGADGTFRFDGVVPGAYTARASFGGATAERPVQITAGSEVVVDLSPSGEPEVIHVEGSASDAHRRSAEAVNVVDTERAHTQSADLGEVLARTQGVAVRRTAGLGSSTRFSIDGLSDDQIRFFLDEVPLAIAGYPFGLANVPVNLVDHVEIYRGVVPVRFGADALGGAVNLVSSNRSGSHGSASYQVGSFGTHRLTLAARHADERTGVFAGATLFVDRAKNDYDVDVQVPDAQGRLHDATVPRFHDAYTAAGMTAEVGVADRSWADRLALRGFTTGYDKELQNNAVMTVPYGEVTYGERVAGASTRYQVALPGQLRLDVIGAYARRTIRFRDASEWVYDWYGNHVLQRRVAGEIDGHPHDDAYWQRDSFARALVSRALPGGELRLSISPSHSRRTGQDLTLTDPAERDPLSARHARTTIVSGIEWAQDALDGRIENISFAKSYVFHAAYEDVLPGNIFRSLTRDSTRFGGGDGLRWRPVRWLSIKASYEYATRLPSTDELFGNGALIGQNPTLEPEVSHNANLGSRVELGDLTIEVSAFWRESKNQIVLLGNNQFLTYQNVYTARSIGVDAGASWTLPHLTLDASGSFDDLRNVSRTGTFGAFDGDRIPNRPWLFASFGARGRLGAFEPFYVGRYVHAFLRGWESIGLAQYKQSIPAQLSHDAGVTYTARSGSITFEIDNLANARLYDSFGAQRPGRAYFLKLTGDL